MTKKMINILENLPESMVNSTLFQTQSDHFDTKLSTKMLEVDRLTPRC